jgi:zinc/manganese transport system substrate-binding protein
VLVNGLHFEGFLQRLVEASATKATVVELTKGVETLATTEEEHEQEGEEAHEAEAQEGQDHGAIDPHAFQSIANAKIYVKNIAGAFCSADSAGCDIYKGNAEAYTEKLDALESEVKAAVASIPQDKRTVITSHDAFGYFQHEYGLTFLAPEGISTDAEASAADVAKLIEQVRHDKASAIFVENITNQRLIEQIASETGLKIGGTLYSDALSDANGPAGTYIDMMRNNIGAIKGAILGS